MEENVRHRWEKRKDGWYMVCEVEKRSFKTSYDWSMNDGHCRFCGEDAITECKERKKRREAYYRNNPWEKKRFGKDRNLKEFIR